jgi:short-subunit dehydrogenase
MERVSDGLHQELAGELRITTLLPGYTATNFADHIYDEQLRAKAAAGGLMAMPDRLDRIPPTMSIYGAAKLRSSPPESGEVARPRARR